MPTYWLSPLFVIAEEKAENKQFYIECKGDETFWVKVKGADTIGDIKAEIQEQEDIPYDQQRLIFGGKKLEDDRTIKDIVEEAGEKETARLHFILESIGGGTCRTR